MVYNMRRFEDIGSSQGNSKTKGKTMKDADKETRRDYRAWLRWLREQEAKNLRSRVAGMNHAQPGGKAVR